MRNVFFLLAVVVLASCGNHKMRFAKTRATQQKVVEIAEDRSLKTPIELVIESNEEEHSVVTSQVTTMAPITVNESNERSLDANPVDLEDDALAVAPNDSTKVSKEEADLIVEEAIWAEKRGSWSLMFSLLTPLLFIAGGLLFAYGILGYSPFAAVLGLVLVFGSVASIVFSYVFGVKSLNAQFNTPKGRKRAIAGIVISSIFAGLFLLNILLNL